MNTVPDSPIASSFVQARFYSPAHRSNADLLWCVWHDAEAKIGRETAENLGSWWHGAQSSHASSHYGCDMDSIVQYVHEQDTAWSCGHTGNLYGISIELAGFASMTVEQWLATTPMLSLAARLGACISKRREFPIQWLSVDDVRAKKKGHCSHRTLAMAFGETHHTDLGLAFETEVAPRFISMMAAA